MLVDSTCAFCGRWFLLLNEGFVVRYFAFSNVISLMGAGLLACLPMLAQYEEIRASAFYDPLDAILLLHDDFNMSDGDFSPDGSIVGTLSYDRKFEVGALKQVL